MVRTAFSIICPEIEDEIYLLFSRNFDLVEG